MIDNRSHDMRAFDARIEQAAFAVARGTDGITDLALALADLMVLDPSANARMAGSTYDALRAKAEAYANAAGKPLKVQKASSHKVQVSKLTVFGELGELARKNHAALDVLRKGSTDPLVKGNYTATTDIARALRKRLNREPLASAEALTATMQDALPEAKAPATVADKVQGLHKRLVTLSTDPEEGEADLTPYADRDPRIASAVAAALLHLKAIGDMVVAIDKAIEAERDAAPAEADAE